MENTIQPLKTLVSMTHFVCHIRSMTTTELCNTYPKKFVTPVWKGDQSEMVKDMLSIDAIKWYMTGEYMKFLKQPLTLSMFICVSEAGEVLEEPEYHTEFLSDAEQEVYEYEVYEYQKAKDKIMFEGFEVKEYDNVDHYHEKELKCGNVCIAGYYNNQWRILQGNKNIEALVHHGLTLTPNALKLIYG